MNREWTAGNESEHNSKQDEVDATLRVVASLPAPEGLEDRVREALRTAPRTARVLQWPARFVTDNAWVRGAAAAAIAFAVAGGGWGVYSRVQTAKVIEMPSQVSSPGFSNAGATRKPETVNGPVIHRPEAQVVELPEKRGEKDAGKKAEPGPGKQR